METEAAPPVLIPTPRSRLCDTIQVTSPVLHGAHAEQPPNSSRAAASLATGPLYIQHTLRTHFRARNAHLCNIACRHELSLSIVSHLCGLAKGGTTCCFSLLAFLYASRRMPDATRWVEMGRNVHSSCVCAQHYSCVEVFAQKCKIHHAIIPAHCECAVV